MRTKLSILIISSLFILSVFTIVPEGVFGLTEYLDPDGDDGTNEWTPTGCSTHSDCVDDAIRQPATGVDGNYLTVTGKDKDEVHTYSNAGASGTVSDVEVWIYGRTGDANDYFNVLPGGVSGWSPSVVQSQAPGTSNSWVYVAWGSLSIAMSEFNSLTVTLISRASGQAGGTWVMEAVYTELTYAAATYDTFYWCGSNCGGDGTDWDDGTNWKAYSGGSWYDPASDDYPKTNADQAFFNETSDSLYLQDGANSDITIGELTTSSGFTGTITFSIDLIIDDAGGENGHFDHQAAATIDVNTSNEGITVDSHFNVSSSATFTERSGTVTMQGATTQEIRVQDTNKLYSLVLSGSGTIGELYDNLTVYQITIGADTTYKADAATRGYELWTNFTDVATCGFAAASSGTLNLIGTYAGPQANVTTAAGGTPTNYWRGGNNPYSPTLSNATLSYFSYFEASGTTTIENTTFKNPDNYAAVGKGTVTTYKDNIVDGEYLLVVTNDVTNIENVVIQNTPTYDLRVIDVRAELVDSNFDTSRMLFGATGAAISREHNDVANAYKIMVKSGTSLSKSTITNDYASGDDVEVVSGTLTIDEASASDDFTIASDATVVQDTATTHTFDSLANLTVSGLIKSDGTITTSADYFDFYIPGDAWMNDSSVSNVDMEYYLGGFNYSIGDSTNTTMGDFTIENVATDSSHNFTDVDFSVKGSGIVAHWNVTAWTGSERIKFLVGNLTASEDYEVYIDSVLANTTTADGSGDIFFSNNSLTHNHIYITWVTSVTPASLTVTLRKSDNTQERIDVGFWGNATLTPGATLQNSTNFVRAQCDDCDGVDDSFWVNWSGTTWDSAKVGDSIDIDGNFRFYYYETTSGSADPDDGGWSWTDSGVDADGDYQITFSNSGTTYVWVRFRIEAIPSPLGGADDYQAVYTTQLDR